MALAQVGGALLPPMPARILGSAREELLGAGSLRCPGIGSRRWIGVRLGASRLGFRGARRNTADRVPVDLAGDRRHLGGTGNHTDSPADSRCLGAAVRSRPAQSLSLRFLARAPRPEVEAG